MQQVKQGVAEWVVSFFRSIAPTTPALKEFITRSPAHAVAMVPGRMVDAAQDMLTLWGRNEPSAGPSKPPKLPVVLVAVARDVTPTGQNRTKGISDPVHIILPGDAKERVFELRTMPRDYRVQLVLVAQDSDSAESLAMQFDNWIFSRSNQVFDVGWEFAGHQVNWPAQFDGSDLMFSTIPTGVKSLTMIAVDVTICATQPIYRAVGDGEVFKSAEDGTLHEQDSGTGLEGNLPRSGVNAQGFPLLDQATAAQKRPDSVTPVSERHIDAEKVTPV